MKIHKLDHVNVRTQQLEKMIEWYEDVLGLVSGFRPHFPFPGAWLYAGDTVLVHLVGVDDDAGAGSEQTLKLEHFAFVGSNAKGLEDKLAGRNETYRRSELLEVNIVQYNVWDPDKNHIHIDFPADE